MLNKKRTAGGARLRLLLALPLTGAMLCASTMAFTKDYGYVDLLPEKSELAIPVQQNPKVENIKKSTAPKVQDIKKDQIKFPPPIVKKDQVKFPPTFKPKNQDLYVVRYAINYKEGNRVRLDKRYVIINGKPAENQDKFYGVKNTESITILNSEEATKRYGSNGKNGAVEITGSNNMTYFDEIVVPPPPRVETVRFPPPQPVFRTEQKYFTPGVKRNKGTGNLASVDKRYIVVNGNPVEDNSKFYGVTKSETVTYLNSTEAIKVYGEEKGKYGAVEIQGPNVYFNKKDDQIKFPPPIVRLEAPRSPESLKTPPPPVEPPPPGYKAKKKISPPPPAEPLSPKRTIKTPPPPVEPPPPRRKTVAPPSPKPPVTGDVASLKK